LDSVTLEDWGEEIFAEGVGVKWRKWVRGEGKGKQKILFFPHPASAPNLYRPSIQLQSKMAASKRFISSVPYSAPK